MRSFVQPRSMILLIVAGIALVILYQFWHWEVERIEVEPGKILIRTHKWGKDLPEETILAPDDSYKGVMLEVLPEGRHFLNPLFWSHEITDIVQVPSGKCAVLTNLSGTPIPRERLDRGEILAHEGERGIVEKVLRPGSYRLNPHAVKWEIVPAVEVGVDQVGVRTLKVGKDPRELPANPQRGRYVVPEGYRGIQEKPAESGTYYLNPYVETITPVEVRSHRVELTDIEFPSRDGFILKPHVLVEYGVLPEKAPEVLVRLTDQGILHQADRAESEIKENEILQKVILPHIRGYSRIEGSNFDARDYMVSTAQDGKEKAANVREQLQRALASKVKPRCLELGIEVRAVTLADLKLPSDLADQIKQRDLARAEVEKNKNLVGNLREMQKLKATQTRSEQASEIVKAGTKLLTAKTMAEQRKKNEESKLKTELESAQYRLEAAKKQAEATLATGTAEAEVTTLKNQAEAAGLQAAIKGFTNAGHYAQFQMLSKLAPALREVFASDESEFARIFATYMNPPPNRPMTPSPVAEMPRLK